MNESKPDVGSSTNNKFGLVMIYNDLMYVFMKSEFKDNIHPFKCCSKELAAVVVLNLRR